MFEPGQDTASLVGGAGDLSFAIYRGREQLITLRDSWCRLAESLSPQRYFHLHPWYRCYLESLEHDSDAVFFCVARRAGKPLAIFPLKRTSRRICGLRMRCLEVPTHVHLNLSDFILDNAADGAALLRLLVGQASHLSGAAWDVIHVANALEDSSVGAALEQFSATQPVVSTPAGRSNYVDCRAPYEQVAVNFKGHFRRNLRRMRRRAREWGELQFHSYREIADMRRHFPEFLRVEASGWKGKRGTHTAISCEPATLAFYQGVMEEFGAMGRCQLNLLELDGRCIAGQLCLLVDGALYILKIGYDEDYAEIAPGNLIMGELIRRCAGQGEVHTISFVTDRRWNYQWGATSATLYTHNIFNRMTLRGWLGFLLCRIKKMAGVGSARSGPYRK